MTNSPFLLQPVGKDYPWGGNKLKNDYGKDINIEPLAESWECSTHQDGINRVASGKYKGMLLSDVLKRHPEYVGKHINNILLPGEKYHGKLPILIKFIDAKKDLSVQVHPDDEYAKIYEKGSLGKTEMWYIVEAEENAKIVYGFYRDMQEKILRKSLLDGTIEKYLRKVSVKKNDVFYIKAGTVHAIGAGTLVAEIQENSNVTYRLFDYQRVDKNGHKRDLHIEKAIDVLDMKSCVKPRQPMRVLKYSLGIATEFLCRCKYFQVERVLLNTKEIRNTVEYKTDQHSFQILLCLNGSGNLSDKRVSIAFVKGDCIFVPANSDRMELIGNAQLLRVSC